MKKNEYAYSKTIPIIGEYDVIVAGAGPAGICAAVSSARLGVSTLLIERYGIIGGSLTSGQIGPLMGNVSRGSMTYEVTSLPGMINKRVHSQNFELLKTSLVNWVNKAGVKIMLQSPVIDVIKEGVTVKGVVVSTPNGMGIIHAKTVVDSTGDGQVAYLAGAKYFKGRDSDNLLQPVSLQFNIAGIDDEKAITKGNWTYDVRMPGSNFRDICLEASLDGRLPETASFVRLYRTGWQGECTVNASQTNFIDGTNTDDITNAEIDLRNQIFKICKYLNENVKGFENAYVRSSATTLGVRETRRIEGEYILHEDDLLHGRKFEDVIVHNAIGIIDIHSIKGGGQDEDTTVPFYDIPYRCFIPLGIDNLLTAGRCISGTHRAHGSYRLMRICMAMGQGVGIAAALSASKNIAPRKLNYKDIQSVLIEQGVDLFK